VTTATRTKRPGDHGFTLLEMLIVIAIFLILCGMAIISINGALPQEQVNSGIFAAMAVIRQGRDSAISERRNFQLLYGPPMLANQIGLERIECPPSCGGPPVTVLPVVTLQPPAAFGLDNSITVDTPDNFGTCSSGLCFGGSPTQQWLSDGTFVNSVGQPLNATVFVHIPGNPNAQRAFTILGTTGRIRAYKWNGSAWVLQ
jgi:prepilin-type N-terminal cleavage/methylation domain-containing protein